MLRYRFGKIERGNAGFILGNDAGLGFLVIQLASVKLRQPHLDQVGREVVAALRIAPPEDTGANVLAELQLERRRMPAVGTSWCHGPSPIKARPAYQFFNALWPTRGGHSNLRGYFWVEINTRAASLHHDPVREQPIGLRQAARQRCRPGGVADLPGPT